MKMPLKPEPLAACKDEVLSTKHISACFHHKNETELPLNTEKKPQYLYIIEAWP